MNEHPEDLSMWTIYEKPLDYPDHFVVRKHIVRGGETFPTHTVVITETLEAARKAVPPGLHNLGRQPEDEAQIVETWV